MRVGQLNGFTMILNTIKTNDSNRLLTRARVVVRKKMTVICDRHRFESSDVYWGNRLNLMMSRYAPVAFIPPLQNDARRVCVLARNA